MSGFASCGEETRKVNRSTWIAQAVEASLCGIFCVTSKFQMYFHFEPPTRLNVRSKRLKYYVIRRS